MSNEVKTLCDNWRQEEGQVHWLDTGSILWLEPSGKTEKTFEAETRSGQGLVGHDQEFGWYSKKEENLSLGTVPKKQVLKS